MKPIPQKGAGAVGAPIRDTNCAAYAANQPDALSAFQFPIRSSEAALAMLAFGANQALASQISLAHILGRLAQEQSKGWANASERTLPEGVARDAVVAAARMQASVADGVMEIANNCGRSFGRLAFAFPVRSHTA